MAPSRFSSLALSAGAVLCLAGSWAGAASAAGAANPSVIAPIPSDVPPGIQVGAVRVAAPRGGSAGPGAAGGAGGDDGGNAAIARAGQIAVLADSQGRPLYFLDAGADCAGDCLSRWQPALAGPNARETAQLKLVSRTSGERQWAFQGKPLYTPVGAASINAAPKRSAPSRGGGGGGGGDGAAVISNGSDGMKPAAVDPKSWIKMPYSIGSAEYRLAPGMILAAGARGATPMGQALYAFSGTPQQEQALPATFKPHHASLLSLPIGDFTVRTRTDGSKQWAYRGSPLYTCDCDISLGDLNGAGAAPGIAPAVVFAYSVPDEVIVKRDLLSVGRMVEAKTGRTLYYRDRMKDAYNPDHTRPMQGTIDPQVSALLGVSHCDAKCEKEWRPLYAPKNAQPQGYWSIYERPDGKRQWAYKNAALYTYLKEGPGSLDGNEKYLVQFADAAGTPALPEEFGMGLNWRAVVP